MSATQNPSSYVTRELAATVLLGRGTFGAAGYDTLTVANLRMAATLSKMGSPGFDSAEIRIYGLTQSVMNQLSTLGVPLPMARLNTVQLSAGDSASGLSVIYQGNIQNAWQNLDGMPDTFLQIVAYAGYFDAIAPIPPTSYKGSTDVATIMAGLAARMGRAFENNGVQVKLSNPYFAGTAVQQAQACAKAADIELYDDGLTLAIWPKWSTRGGAVPLISPESGLIGYPRYTSQGMEFRCLFNPNIKLGGVIQMKSSIQPACGTWYVNKLTYDLSSRLPGGPWFCDVGTVRMPYQLVP